MNTEKDYPTFSTLRNFSVFIEVIGWIGSIIGGLAIVSSITQGGWAVLALPIGAGALATGLGFIVSGQIVRVILQIEANTRSSRDVLLAHFYRQDVENEPDTSEEEGNAGEDKI